MISVPFVQKVGLVAALFYRTRGGILGLPEGFRREQGGFLPKVQTVTGFLAEEFDGISSGELRQRYCGGAAAPILQVLL